MRKKNASGWGLLALANIPGAPQGHPMLFHAQGSPAYFLSDILLFHPRWDHQCRETIMTVPPQLASFLLSFSYPVSFRHPPPTSRFQ